MQHTNYNLYSKCKDNLCLSYTGLIPEYVVQLNYIRKIIQKTYSDIKITLRVRHEFESFVDQQEEEENCIIREFKTSFESHPVMKFIEGSNLLFPKLIPNKGNTCLFCPDAAHPSKSLDKLISPHNYETIIVGSDLYPSWKNVNIRPSGSQKISIVNDATWVIGAENEYTFLAGVMGKRVTLVPSGPGTDLFKTMFPHGELY